MVTSLLRTLIYFFQKIPKSQLVKMCKLFTSHKRLPTDVTYEFRPKRQKDGKCLAVCISDEFQSRTLSVMVVSHSILNNLMSLCLIKNKIM